MPFRKIDILECLTVVCTLRWIVNEKNTRTNGPMASSDPFALFGLNDSQLDYSGVALHGSLWFCDAPILQKEMVLQFMLIVIHVSIIIFKASQF